MRLETLIATFAFTLMLTVTSPAAEGEKRTWNFDHDTTGEIAPGFANEVGTWRVVDAGQGKVLAQSAKNSDPTFNITLIRDTNVKDVEVSVDIKAIAGELDRGGGIVWRAKDAKNYYLARYNPLEDNYRLYHVVDGKRTLLQNADFPHSERAFTLRIAMTGDHIECYYDGKKRLDFDDATITAPGMIGLWSKADAQSQFDYLILIGM